MSRCKDAPIGFECPYRHNCPHLERMSTTWVMEQYQEAFELRSRDKLFTFLRIEGVEPTNNHAERSLRFLVIMRKICFGTRSPEGSESHSVLASILQTAKLHGKNAIQFMVKLLTEPRKRWPRCLRADRDARFALGLNCYV